MRKSSIHIKKSSSRALVHNERVFEVSYAIDSSDKNENKLYINESLANYEKHIYEDYLKHHNKRMPSNASPIREGVCNLLGHHTLADVERMAKKVAKLFNIQLLHISRHRDEGHIIDNEKIYNDHAHIIFGYYDFKTHKTVKVQDNIFNQLQDLVAEELQMQRGQRNSKAVRLEHDEYKRAMRITDEKTKK